MKTPPKHLYCANNPIAEINEDDNNIIIISLLKSSLDRDIDGIVLLYKSNPKIYSLGIFLEVFYQSLLGSCKQAGRLWRIIRNIISKQS